MKKIIQRLLLSLVMTTVFAAASLAAIESNSNKMQGKNIVTNAVLINKDQQYDWMKANPSTWQNSFFINQTNAYVTLKLEDRPGKYYSSSWSMTVTYNVTFTDAANNPTTYSAETLTVAYDPSAGYNDKAIRSYAFSNNTAYHARITVTNVTCNAPGGVPAEVMLDNTIETERYYVFNAAGTPGSLAHYTTRNGVDYASRNELLLTWDFMPGAESYDVEWLFIDVGNEAFTASFGYDMANASRINVPENHYVISTAYPKGIILYRIRGVGISTTSPTEGDPVEGAWTLASTGTASGSSPSARYNFNGMNNAVNWQYSVSFAEDGKRKEAVSFFDGSLRNRQTITVLNTDQNAVIGEAKYDYQGRPVVQVLPAPVTSTGIKYYSNFNPSFDRSNFDTDSKLNNPDAMPETGNSGAGNYYSNNNANTTGARAYIPDANGYPYARTVYRPDGTGRLRSQGGPGPDHKTGAGHETKYFYGTPTVQKELDRLFGNEAGYLRHYKKNAVVDPNGQASVSYIDEHGRVIATALSGEPPANLLAIDNKPAPVSITDSLLDGNHIEGDAMVNINTLLVTSVPTDYDFVYDLDSAQYCDDCLPSPDTCKTCKYDLDITITDEDGTVLTTASLPVDENNIGSTHKEFTYTFTTPGVYRVVKKLTLSQTSIDAYLANFDTAQICIDPDTLLPSDCNMSCDTLCVLQYRRVNASGQFYYVNDAGSTTDSTTAAGLINTCKTACSASPSPLPDECAIKLDIMKIDMSPGGQYFDNTPDEYAIDGTTGQLTLSSSYDWKEWLIANVHADDNSDSWFTNNFGADFNTWQKVRDNWIDSWASFMVTKHPEYCVYQFYCTSNCDGVNISESNEYDQLMYSTNDNSTASSAGYFNPLNMTACSTSCDPDDYLPYTFSSPGDEYMITCEDNCEGTSNSLADVMAIFLKQFIHETTENKYYSIWYVINDPANIHSTNPPPSIDQEVLDLFYTLHGNPNASPATSGLIGTGTNQISKYQFFRSVYTFYKKLIIYHKFDNYRTANSCSSSLPLHKVANTGLTSDGFIPHWPSNEIFDYVITANINASCGIDIVIDTDTLLDLVDIHSTTLCEESCEGTAESWMTLLNTCVAETLKTAIKDYLIDICAIGCSDDYPEGRDSVGSGTHVEGPGGVDFFNFDDVIDYYNTTYSASCPVPVHPVVYDQSQCDCEQFTSFLDARGIMPANPASPTTNEKEDIADALNEFFDVTTWDSGDYNDFVTWLSECYVGTPPTPTHSTLTTANYPEHFTCTEDEFPIEDFDPADADSVICELEDSASQAYFIDLVYKQKLEEAKDDYLKAYREYCLNSLAGRETFTVTYDLNEYLYTLYYYDQAGNLVKTVPPEGVEFITAATGSGSFAAVREYRKELQGSTFTVPPHRMKTNYKYNSLQQLIEQTMPDGDGDNTDSKTAQTSYFWYDAIGRMVVSQNEKQAVATGSSPYTYSFSYTNYDELSRIIEVGQKAYSKQMTYAISRDQDPVTSLSQWMGAGVNSEVTQTFYDLAQYSIPNFTQQNLRNRVASVVIDLADDGSRDHATHYSYDIHGNVNSLVQDNPALSSLSQQYKRIDYEYDLVSGNVNAVHYETGWQDQMHHYYDYDADNRIIRVYTSTQTPIMLLGDAVSSPPQRGGREGSDRDAKYFYYPHGPLSRTETGDHLVQGQDFAYTIHGWIKGVNAGTLNNTRDMGQDGYSRVNRFLADDAGGYLLGYYNSDYTTVSGTTAFIPTITGNYASACSSLYNGNISRMITALTDNSENKVAVQGNAYKYDQLNRIRHSNSFTNVSGGDLILANNTFSGATDGGFYSEEFHFDFNGNISTVKRNGNNTGGTQPMDDFTYRYHLNLNGSLPNKKENNLLLGVNDAISSTNYANIDIDDQGTITEGTPSTWNYRYDKIGNLNKDVSEQIESISWTVYGKVDEIKRTTGSTRDELKFYYDASGNRIAKIRKPRTGGNPPSSDPHDWLFTYYVRDAQGNILATYEKSYDGQDLFFLEEHYLYGSQRLGILKHQIDLTTTPASTNLFERTLGRKNYEFSNHLGNVLVTFSDRKIPNDNYTFSDIGSGTSDWNQVSDGSTNFYYAGTSQGNYYRTSGADGYVDSYTADVLSANDYFAFGAPMPGRNFNTTSYRMGFNGKENDNETYGVTGTEQDYGMRIYNNRLGRFLSVDPLTAEFPWYTPYQYAGNKPIASIDLDGLEDIYYLPSFLKDQGKAAMDLLNETEVGKEILDAFKNIDPNKGPINQGVNAFIAEKSLSGGVGGETTLFISNTALIKINGVYINYLDALKQARDNKDGDEYKMFSGIFGEEFLNSEGLGETIEKRRGFLFVFIHSDNNSEPTKENNFGSIGITAKIVGHEFGAHANNIATGQSKSTKEEHADFTGVSSEITLVVPGSKNDKLITQVDETVIKKQKNPNP